MEGLQAAIRIYKMWRFSQMVRETMGIVKGIGIGMAAAAAVTAVGAKLMKDNRRLRRSVHRAVHAAEKAAGDMLGNMSSALK